MAMRCVVSASFQARCRGREWVEAKLENEAVALLCRGGTTRYHSCLPPSLV